VADYVEPSSSGRFLEQPQSVPAARGWSWYVQGWDLYSRNPWMWIGLVVALMILGFVMGFALQRIPYGTMVQYFVFPFTAAAVATICDGASRGATDAFEKLVPNLSAQAPQLLLLGGLYLGGVLVASAIAMLPLLGTHGLGILFGGAVLQPSDLNMNFALAFLLMMALILPLFMAIWFAPTLVVLHQKPAATAMVLSFLACLRNILPFLIYGLISVPLAIAATIPLLLGWLVLGPVLMISSYAAYREIFFES
jgi:uncharacterized membrane protein